MITRILTFIFLSVSSAYSAPPDLTNGGRPIPYFNPDSEIRYSNLGPTGILGWAYHVDANTSESRQIWVQEVDVNSPASGKLALGDVILGANGTGENPINFTADARRSFSNAVNNAEARDPAEIKVLRWRDGTTTIQTLTLRHMGAYSATAPYNCPKSAKILEEGLQSLMRRESAGYGSFGTLALLAGNNPNNPNNAARQLRARNEARALTPSAAEIEKMTSGELGLFSGREPWRDGHHLIVLTEYYLSTNDSLVLPAITALSKCISNGQTPFGGYGHRYSTKWRDGSPNGPMRNAGYNTVNNSSMLGWLGLLLTRECGVSHSDLNPAIARASGFYAYYAGKGAIPYGEHEPYDKLHDNNGKSGLAALSFALENTRSVEQKFFAKSAITSASEREEGHTGPYFSHSWSPLGAAVGGDAAAVAYFRGVRWMLDLNRRWDGGFVYDSLNSESRNDGGGFSSFNSSTPALLLYALPLRQLHITGRGQNSSRWLSDTDVSEAVAADNYSATHRDTTQLVTDLGSWSPVVRRKAAEELGIRTSETASLLTQLHSLATDQQSGSRAGACFALGYIGNPSSAAVLASLLTDPSNLVRYAATKGLKKMPQIARGSQLNTVLAAAAANAAPLFPLVQDDPAQLTHSIIGPLLFSSDGMVPTDFSNLDKAILFPAIRAVASNPVGECRKSIARIYDALTRDDYLTLADTVVNSAYELTPADNMSGYLDRTAAQRLLLKYKAAEGVSVSVLSVRDDMFRAVTPDAVETLRLYAGGSKTVSPDPGLEAAMNLLIQSGNNAAKAQAVLAAIIADPSPAILPPLKSIQSVIADSPALTLPRNLTRLRTTSHDYAKGDSIYTWRKIRGAGNVTFSPNGTGAAKNTVVLFDGIPGKYLFEVKMSDSKNLTEVFSTVAVTLNNTGGTLPANDRPIANNQSLSVLRATASPITLTAIDPEAYGLNYRVISHPTNGRLVGNAPHLIYTSNSNFTGSDSFTYEVIDSEGQVSNATVTIIVSANTTFPTAIYEPFNYTVGALNGRSGSSELGFSGTWAAGPDVNTIGNSLSHGNLPTLGGSLSISSWRTSARRLLNPSALRDTGLLNDGSTLWFSLLIGYTATADTQFDRAAFALANSSFDTSNSADYNILNESAQLGAGLGITLGRFEGNGDQSTGKLVATHFRDSTSGSGFSGNITGSVPRTFIGPNQQRLIVGKFTWGSASDKLEIFQPDTNLNLGPITSTLTVNVNQSAFDTLTLTQNGGYTFDEIRFGSNYASVLNGNAQMALDTRAPTPASMAFHQAPTVVSNSSIAMLAVGAYDPSEVEYYFSCTAGGGRDSGWQDSPSYTDTGLTPGILYSYQVKARDKSPAKNESIFSSTASATISTQATVPNIVGMQQADASPIISIVGMSIGSVTYRNNSDAPAGTIISQTPTADQILPLGSSIALQVSNGDFVSPTPNPASFAVAPVVFNTTSITMTATTGSDASGVEYRFTETSGNPGGSSSNWQDSPTFTDTDLNSSTQYSYTVAIRDKSPNANQTAASAPASATTGFVAPTSIWHWDGGNSDIPTNGNGISSGGDGTWNNTLRNWDVGMIPHVAWQNDATKTAVFGGNPGIVTIAGGGVGAGIIQFASAGYTITGGPLTLNGPSPIQITLPATIQSAITGDVGLTYSGVETLTLSGNSSYNGITTIANGTLAAGNLANAGTNSSIGSFPTPGATGLILTGGNFSYTGASTTSNRGFTAIGTAEKTINVAAGVNLNLGASIKNETSTTGLTFTAAGAGSSITISSMTIAAGSNADINITTNSPYVTIQDLNVSGSNVIAQRTGVGTMLNIGNINGTSASGWLSNLNIAGVISGYTGGIFLGGNVTLTGLSNFGAKVTIQQGGTYIYNSIKNVGGGASALGAPTTSANGMIDFGNGANTPIFRYTGTGDTTNRILNLRGGGTLNLEQAGTSHLHFTASTSADTGNTGAKTLNLTGSTVGTGEFSGAIGEHTTTNRTSVSKSGTGKWTLSGANVYTGTTTINAGTLALGANNVIPNVSSVSLGAATLDAATFTDTAGTFAVTAAATINLGSSAALTFADSSAVAWPGTLNITGTFTSSSLRFGTNESGLTQAQMDKITVNGLGIGDYELNPSGYLIFNAGPPDVSAPTPSPMTWANVPAALGSDSITMTATTATDTSGIEYYFDETSGNPGGTDSGWQNSPTYLDTGLNPNTLYSYNVTARDKSINQNTTATSATASATTNALPLTTVWNVNIGNETIPSTYAGAVAQASPIKWNAITSATINGMALADSRNSTNAGITLDVTNDRAPGTQTLTSGDPIFNSFFNAGFPTITLNGLTVSNTYDIVFYSAAWWQDGVSLPITQTLGTGLTGTFYLNRLSSGTQGVVPALTQDTNPNDVTSGTGNVGNWARIVGIVPDINGRVRFRLLDTQITWFNAFQLVRTGTVAPRADILALGLPNYPGTINGTNITIKVPFGTDRSSLAPVFTLWPGATCNPVSGTARNFNSSQNYTVTSSDSLVTKVYTVTVEYFPPLPEFTLTAPTNWNGRQSITVQPVVSNLALLQANNGTNFSYSWTTNNVAVTQTTSPSVMTLTQAQDNGALLVNLTLSNGSVGVTRSATINITQPATDPWVERTPIANEKPVQGQFFARNPFTNLGTLYYRGTQSGTPEDVFLKVFRTPSGGSETLYSTTRQTLTNGNYDFSVTIEAGLFTYRAVYGTRSSGIDTNIATVNNIICGDAFIIEGQSNAQATANDDNVANPQMNTVVPWIYTYNATLGWGPGYAKPLSPEWGSKVGYWGMKLAQDLVTQHSMPVCLINGALGGTRIDEHLPNPAGRTLGTGIYANLLNRVIAARLTHGIRGVFWHQGENDSAYHGPPLEPDHLFYEQNFLNMSSAWKQDFPNFQRYVMFQIAPDPCSIGPFASEIREIQRQLPRLYSNMSLVATIAIPGYGGCHYTKAGYENMAARVLPVVNRDFYGVVPVAAVTPPNLVRAYFANSSRTAIALQFDQPMNWSSFSTRNYHINDLGGLVTSGGAAGNIVTLQLSSAATVNSTIDYVKDTWNYTESVSSLLFGTNALTALTFADVPIDAMSPFQSWASARGLSPSDSASGADPDRDGVSNILEYVLGGEPNPSNPGSNSASLLPKASSLPSGDLVYTFRRKKDSVGNVDLAFHWSSDLSFPALNTMPIGAVSSSSNGISIEITSFDASTDSAVITISGNRAIGGKLFGRIGVKAP